MVLREKTRTLQKQFKLWTSSMVHGLQITILVQFLLVTKKRTLTQDLAANANDVTTTSAKSVGLSGGIFTGEAMSIAFNVNDNLSISYSEVEDTHDGQNAVSGADGEDSTMKTESIQIAYTMGSMSINAYSTETSNPNYDTDADNLNVNEIAIGLAF